MKSSLNLIISTHASAAGLRDLFVDVDRENKIYAKKGSINLKGH